MRPIVGILKSKEKPPYNYRLEEEAYNVYRRLPGHRLEDMVGWRDKEINKLRNEIRYTHEPILNALKKALAEKNEV